MDFLKKAKAQLKELENDLNKATASLGLGEKREEAATPSAPAAPAYPAAQTPVAAEPTSASSTPATSTVNTPATSVAPSIAPEAPKTKLPLAIRKNVRDNWELQQPELEANISGLLGVPWKTSIDPGYLYTLAESRYAKESPGQMIAKYVEAAHHGINEYLKKFGSDGKSELNSVCSTHTITLEPATSSKISYAGCEISGGMLRLMFGKGYLGSNITEVCTELAGAVNAAGKSFVPGGGAALDFDAKNSIRNDYEPAIGDVKARISTLLALPVVTLHPNFEQNFAKIAAYTASGQQSNMYPRDWQKRLGGHTLLYFEGLANQLERAGFKNDEMLQEGFKDVVERNEIGLRIVDRLVKGSYNECVIEGGVLYMQTTLPYWTSNIRDTGAQVLDLL
ncbi:MAG: hypothetical protein M1827_001870 [Pycnora praestabilis]|nr:MAG: hypothetical protein M1827_001870 [Pycnora praestabilis]